MQSGCRWVYTLMDWDTGEVVAKGTSVELVDARDVAMTAQLLAAYAKEVH